MHAGDAVVVSDYFLPATGCVVRNPENVDWIQLHHLQLHGHQRAGHVRAGAGFPASDPGTHPAQARLQVIRSHRLEIFIH